MVAFIVVVIWLIAFIFVADALHNMSPIRVLSRIDALCSDAKFEAAIAEWLTNANSPTAIHHWRKAAQDPHKKCKIALSLAFNVILIRIYYFGSGEFQITTHYINVNGILLGAHARTPVAITEKRLNRKICDAARLYLDVKRSVIDYLLNHPTNANVLSMVIAWPFLFKYSERACTSMSMQSARPKNFLIPIENDGWSQWLMALWRSPFDWNENDDINTLKPGSDKFERSHNKLFLT